jgi:polar amino acid transport system permease protein
VNFTARAIIALTIGYSAFISEIFRAGIQSIGRGQMEAARSLGMSSGQAMRYVILPQAIRNVLPPLGNDFIAMLKDSSLVSVLGVQDITQLGKVYSASTFRFFETYNVVAYLYLIMTVGLALVVRVIEKRMPARV